MDLYQFMIFYKDAFDPKYFLLLFFILIVFYDWKNSSQKKTHFVGRLSVIFFCYIAAVIIADFTLGQIVGNTTNYPQYLYDYSNLLGLNLGLCLGIVLWRKLSYGNELIYAVYGLIAVSVPFAVISYFWNISGHVTYTAAPVTYLVLLDRRLILLYVIPVIMVFNRPYVGAHTPLQSIAGFILGTLLMMGVVKAVRKYTMAEEP